MGTIADKKNKLLQTKSDIRQAIIGKGVPVDNSDTFASYAAKIGAIQGGGADIGFPDKTSFGGSKWTEIPQAVKDYVNTQVDWERQFISCVNLVEVSGITARPTALSYAFSGYTSLRSIIGLDLADTPGSHVLNQTFGNQYNPLNNLTALALLNFGKPSAFGSVEFKGVPNWDRDSMYATFASNSFDRAAAGLSKCVVSLSGSALARLSESDIAEITAKGFTLST